MWEKLIEGKEEFEVKRAKGGHEVVLIGVAGWQQEETLRGGQQLGSDLGSILSLLELGLDLGALLSLLLELLLELAKSCAALTLALSVPV